MPTISMKVTSYKEVKDPIGSAKKLRPPKRVPTISAMLLTSVLIVPGIAKPLFSCEHGWEVDGIRSFLNESRRLQLCDGSFVDFNPRPKYTVNLGTSAAAAPLIWSANAADVHRDPDTTHAILGHFGVGRIQSAWGKSHGINLHDFKHDPTKCSACRLAGAQRKPFKRANKTEAKSFGDRVSSDLCGPFPLSTPAGFKYIVTFTDHATGEVSVYFLKTKEASAVTAAFKQFLADNRDFLPDGRVKEWHCDNGGEFTSADLDEFCAEFACKRSYSIPWVPQSNATAERTNGILLRPARIMIAAEGADETLWPWAISQAAHIHNRLPTKRFDPPKSPHEAKTGVVPGLGHLHVLFRKCIVRLEDADIANKISPTGAEAAYLGYDERRGADFVYIKSLKRITTSHHVDHLDDKQSIDVSDVSGAKVYYREKRDLSTPGFGQPTPTLGKKDAPPSGLRAESRDTVPHNGGTTDTTAAPNAPRAVGTQPPEYPHVRLRFAGQDSVLPTITNSSFLRLCVVAETFELATHSNPDKLGAIPLPNSWKEIVESPYAKEWIAGCKRDLAKKLANGAWEVVDDSVLQGRKPLKGKWACVVKYKPSGEIDEFRSRWVGCGYSQIAGIDFDEISAGVLRLASARMLLAIGAIEDLDLHHLDISAAFTHAELDRDIYIEMPHGFEETGKVCKLIKGLEGLRQSGRLWFDHNAKILEGMGFTQSAQDPSLWTKSINGFTVRIGVYVDDCLCLWPKELKAEYKEFVTDYSKALDGHVKDLGEVARFVGMEITRNRSARTLTITQTRYIEKLQSKYASGNNYKHWSGPIASTDAEIKRWNDMKPAENDSENVRLQGKDYMGLIGSLLYISNGTRPDVAYHTNYLAQFMQKPTEQAYESAMSVLLYLIKTKDFGITYGGALKPPGFPVRHGTPTVDNDNWVTNLGMHVLSDASWGVPNPYGGHVIMFANGAISWMSRKIKVVCDSSTEAELAAGAVAAKDLKFARSFLYDAGVIISTTVPHAIDNSGAFDTVRNPGVTGRTKHFERWIHYLRDMYRRLSITIHLTPDTDMAADMMTKALYRIKHSFCRDYVLNR